MKRLRYLSILLLLVTVSFSTTKAQSSGAFGVPNLLKYDNKLFHFGFLLGYNMADFTIHSKADCNDNDTLNIINTRGYSGFNLGIVTDLRMGKYFDLRFIPTLSFFDRSVAYNDAVEYHQNTNPKNNVAGAVYMDLPLLVKMKSSRMMNNVRAYVLAGAQYSLDLTSIAKKHQNNVGYVLRLHPGDVHAIAVSHGEGRFYAPEETIRELFKNGQVATQYVDHNGNPTMSSPENPNGSLYAIEGITSPDGRILGKMGHSERYIPGLMRNIYGEKDQHIFESGVKYFK